MTTAEMDEAIAEAGHAVANGDRADVMRIARALLALDYEVTDLTATLNTARAECERLRAGLLEAAAERDAATARAERAEQARLDAVAIASRLEAEDYRTMPKLHQRDRTVAATERARVVEAIAAYHDDEACQHDGVDAGPWDSGAYAAHKMSAEHVRSHNWAPPEENGK